MKEGLHAILNKMIVEGGLRVMKSWIQLLKHSLSRNVYLQNRDLWLRMGTLKWGGLFSIACSITIGLGSCVERAWKSTAS